MADRTVDDVDGGWSIVIPVKRLDRAKTRLRLAPGLRAELALAMAIDTVAAALACAVVNEVVAVTDDPQATAALSALGARVVADHPDAGLNPALRHGASLAREPRIGFVSSDLPALTADDLSAVLRATAGHRSAFVADTSGEGTTMLLIRENSHVEPRFGAASRSAHEAAGSLDITAVAPVRARRDVDTLEDLQAAAALSVGAATAALLPAVLTEIG